MISFGLYPETDMSRLTDVLYVQTCICCEEKQYLESKGIPTSDGYSVCSDECLKIWEGEDIVGQSYMETLEAKSDKCVFCNGKGKIAIFHHIENGKCFRCKGTGKKSL